MNEHEYVRPHKWASLAAPYNKRHVHRALRASLLGNSRRRPSRPARAQVEKLSAFDHYRYLSEGFGVHFIHARARGPKPIPIVLTHGWPRSHSMSSSPRCPDSASRIGPPTPA